MSAEVVILATGAANIASVKAAFARIGCGLVVAEEPQRVVDAKGAVLPGVGAFGPAMQALHEQNLVEALRERIKRDRPLLAICLGMQLLGAASEESSDWKGLGVFDTAATRFRHAPRVPHMGWNEIVADERCAMLESGQAYFANSYRLSGPVPDVAVAWSDYGGRFVAGFERGAMLACQFHPELSGAWGLSVLQRWLLRCGSAAC